MRRSTIVALAFALLGIGALGAFFSLDISPGQGGSVCPSNYAGHPLRSQASKSSFAAITEYSLPSPQRSPNAIAVAPDGSVWFGEESLPAFGHLYPNGSLVEYPWPGSYPPPGTIDYSCSVRTQIWGVALWDNKVWGSDSAGNQLVGFDPATGVFNHVSMPSTGSFPYSLTVSPDGSLWFTELLGQALASLNNQGRLVEYPVPTGLRGTPEQIYFVNSTYALYADAGQAGEGNAGVFSFNPADPVFARVGSARHLNSVTGLAVTSRGLWISEHGPAYVEYYDFASGKWSDYPTSIDAYSRGTYVYSLQSTSDLVWFNEHFGNRIAQVNPAASSMIEYSASDPPASNISSISNVYTIARDGMKVWFTASGANRIGLADYSFQPPFEIHASSPGVVRMKPGTNATVNIAIAIRGSSVSPLSLLFSDSESQAGRPGNITAVSTFSSLVGETGGSFTVTLKASAIVKPGNYTFDVTVSDGITRYTQFLSVEVDAA